jgi:iron complex outermembrane receptor protein
MSRTFPRPRRTRAGLVLLGAFVAPLPAAGQESGAPPEPAGAVVTLPEMTVTGTRAPRPIEQVPQTVQVIERDEIERQAILSPSPAEAIARLVPGFSPTTQTISGASENFRGRDVLVLLDGVPLNTPLRDVSRILALIDPNAVERVETVAGASSLYGAGATGGSINIITRRPTEGPPRFSLNPALRAFPANVGRSLSPELSLGVTGRAQTGLDYVVVGTLRHTGRTYDGQGRELPSDALLGQGGADRTDSGNLFARFGYDLDAARRFEVSAMLIRLEQNPDFLTLYSPPRARPDFASPYEGQSVREASQFFTARYTDTDFALGSLSVVGYYNDIEKRFNYSRFSFPFNSLVYYSGNPASPTSPANQTTLYSTRYGLNLTIDSPIGFILPGARFTWGGDVIHERTRQELTDGRDVFTPLEQTTLAAFGLLQVPVGPYLTLRGGLRYEHFSLSVDDFVRPAAFTAIAARNAAGFQPFVLPALRVTGGDFSYDAFTANAGATIRIAENTELYGGFSQGFALPNVGSFTRRAGLSTAFACPVARPNCLPAGATVGYASIGPEAQIVNSYELGVRRRGADFNAGLVGFISTSDQGVTFNPPDQPDQPAGGDDLGRRAQRRRGGDPSVHPGRAARLPRGPLRHRRRRAPRQLPAEQPHRHPAARGRLRDLAVRRRHGAARRGGRLHRPQPADRPCRHPLQDPRRRHHEHRRQHACARRAGLRVGRQPVRRRLPEPDRDLGPQPPRGGLRADGHGRLPQDLLSVRRRW